MHNIEMQIGFVTFLRMDQIWNAPSIEITL